jgi:hypothetical protein
VSYEIDESYIYCDNCGAKIHLDTEKIIPGIPREKNFSQVLSNGRIVIIAVEEHPWSGEIAIIRSWKPGFYRLELHGELVWMPEEWVKSHELDDSD